MKIRLIDPYISHSQKVIKNIWFARLTLTTLAALTPPDVEVKITDENVEPIEASLRRRLKAETSGWRSTHGAEINKSVQLNISVENA